MDARAILEKFGTPCTLKELETRRLTEPSTTFYLVPTHFETTLPLEEIVARINQMFDNDTFLYRVPLRGTETVLNDTGFSWKFQQEAIPNILCGAYDDTDYCTTSINVYKKKGCPGVYIVEAIRLNGNSYFFFHVNWKRIQEVFA